MVIRNFFKFIGLGFSVCFFVACSASPVNSPTIGSESHFLQVCNANSDCHDDLTCTGGICSIPCEEANECIDYCEGSDECTESASNIECRVVDNAGWCAPTSWIGPNNEARNNSQNNQSQSADECIVEQCQGGDPDATGCPAPEFQVCASDGQLYCDECVIHCHRLTVASDPSTCDVGHNNLDCSSEFPDVMPECPDGSVALWEHYEAQICAEHPDRCFEVSDCGGTTLCTEDPLLMPVSGLVGGHEFIFSSGKVGLTTREQPDGSSSEHYVVSLFNYHNSCTSAANPDSITHPMAINFEVIHREEGTTEVLYGDGHGASVQYGMTADDRVVYLVQEGTLTLDLWATQPGSVISGTIDFIAGNDSQPGPNYVRGRFHADLCD